MYLTHLRFMCKTFALVENLSHLFCKLIFVPGRSKEMVSFVGIFTIFIPTSRYKKDGISIIYFNTQLLYNCTTLYLSLIHIQMCIRDRSYTRGHYVIFICTVCCLLLLSLLTNCRQGFTQACCWVVTQSVWAIVQANSVHC